MAEAAGGEMTKSEWNDDGKPRGIRILNEEWPQKGGHKKGELGISPFLSLMRLYAA
jgi:hypothetical protein